jgi:hypothetical protein
MERRLNCLIANYSIQHGKEVQSKEVYFYSSVHGYVSIHMHEVVTKKLGVNIFYVYMTSAFGNKLCRMLKVLSSGHLHG